MVRVEERSRRCFQVIEGEGCERETCVRVEKGLSESGWLGIESSQLSGASGEVESAGPEIGCLVLRRAFKSDNLRECPTDLARSRCVSPSAPVASSREVSSWKSSSKPSLSMPCS